MIDAYAQVTTRYYCAAVKIVNGKVVECAPVLRWAQGWTAAQLANYCKKKSLKFELLAEGEESSP